MRLAGPALVLGACWPFLLLSLLLSVSRLVRSPSPRAVLLFVAALGNGVFVLAVAYALHSSGSNFLAADQAGLVGLIVMLVSLASGQGGGRGPVVGVVL